MAVTDTVRGDRPDITPAQIAGALLAGGPNLLVLFGIELSGEKSAALGGLIAIGVTLVGGDAYLRAKRNEADAAKHVAESVGRVGEYDVDAAGEDPYDALSADPIEVDGEDPYEIADEDPIEEGEFEDEDDDPTGEEYVPEDVTLPLAGDGDRSP